MITLSTQEHFDSAHFLPGYKGKCARLHGHTWEVEVEYKAIEPVMLDEQNMLVDFSAVRAPISDLDHLLLNDIDGLENPTAEVIAMFLFTQMPTPLCACMVTVTVWEGRESYASWTGMILPEKERDDGSVEVSVDEVLEAMRAAEGGEDDSD